MKRNNRGGQGDKKYGRSESSKDQYKGNQRSDQEGTSRSERPSYGGKYKPAPRPKFGKPKFGSNKPQEFGENPFKKDNPLRKNRSEGGFTKSDKPYSRGERDSERPKRDYDKPKRDFEKSDKPYGRGERDSDRPKRDYDKPKRDFDKSDKPYGRGERDSDRPKRDYDKPRRDFDKSDKPYGREERDSDRPKRDYDKPKRDFGKSDKPYGREERDSDRPKRDYDKPKRDFGNSDKSYGISERSSEKRNYDKPGRDDFRKSDDPSEYKTVYKGRGKNEKPQFETVRKDEYEESKRKSIKKPFFKEKGKRGEPTEQKPTYNFSKFEKNHRKHDATDEIRLNKYIANSGICSRREADSIIEKGQIRVNGEVITEMGYKVQRQDRITLNGKPINPEKPVYVLLNKPKDFITTTDDPLERRTVMNLVHNACEERIFPVGRLDRNTTGLLLFTNDGDLAAKLSHPSGEIKKIYQVTLDKPLTSKDADDIMEGLTLEDGLVKVDDLQVLSKDRTILGLEIHVGKNRIVRRIFAHLGYEVTALDRVMYAGLTKKDIPRGNYRFLTEKEVINLKYFK
ncbi:pseudouridine synthase [Litoribacter populi]|uniref:pseudouridine synthase n=1 Tax=Litoribacter populi TaxID=2598460 RepID=UPI00117E2216|nr:pseudouridine synthase [Litoribacter populi]